MNIEDQEFDTRDIFSPLHPKRDRRIKYPKKPEAREKAIRDWGKYRKLLQIQVKHNFPRYRDLKKGEWFYCAELPGVWEVFTHIKAVPVGRLPEGRVPTRVRPKMYVKRIKRPTL